ncbi:MAG: ABC transporter permease [Bacteroidales bacterium]|nr:ABC transporter permease [Bacteroidales bacterium]
MMNTLNKTVFFVKEVYQQRSIIRHLVKTDLNNKYKQAYLGLFWLFLKPALITLAILFAINYGLDLNVSNSGQPNTLWILCGLVPWFFISDVVRSTTRSLLEYSNLIKSGNIKASIIPVIKILSSITIHLVFIVILAVIAFAFGYRPTIYWIQLIYLFFAATILLTGIGWLISSINVFIRDISVSVSVILTIAFWITPIIWSYHQLADNLKYVALLNPFFYITEGYRYTFMQKAWMFNNTEMTVFFWSTTLIILLAGALTFKYLAPRFAEDL